MKIMIATLAVMMLAFTAPANSTAEVNVNIGIGIPLPPPIVFRTAPSVIVMPDTIGIYFVPDIDAEIYFRNGYWWRLWDGHWYRSRYYNRGWAYYSGVPRFYYDIDPRWRDYYHERSWRGHHWNYQRVPHHRLQQNWKTWNSNRYWEKQRVWGVQHYRPMQPQQRQELRQQRQEQYRHNPTGFQQPRPQQVQPRPQQVQPRPQQPVERPQPQGQPQNRPQHGRPDGGHFEQRR